MTGEAASGQPAAMRKVAVFGNAGAGKSTLARRLAGLSGLPLHPLDLVKYQPGGGEVSPEAYKAAHAGILASDAWIIDGYGDLASTWDRLGQADTLIYLDLPLATHYWWVTKRLFKGAFATPEGWPDGSPIWRGSISSYKVVGLCHRHLTPQYRRYVVDARARKRVYHLRSAAQIAEFWLEIGRELEAARS